MCELLSQTGLAGTPSEHLYHLNGKIPSWAEHWRLQTYPQFVEKILQTTSTANGVFGTKIMWGYLRDVLTGLSGNNGINKLPHLKILNDAFYHPKFIFLRRKDKVRQAISALKAKQTGMWTSEVSHKRQLSYSYSAIDYWLNTLTQHELNWSLFFSLNNIQVLEIFYEDLVQDQHGSIKYIFDYLGVMLPDHWRPHETTLRIQKDESTENWYKYFVSDKTAKSLRLATVKLITHYRVFWQYAILSLLDTVFIPTKWRYYSEN